MEQAKRVKRIFSPEQKLHILQAIEAEVKNGMKLTASLKKQGIASSVYTTWKKRFAMGMKQGLRNGKSPADQEKKRMERENAKLREIILSQSQMIADLKKETNWE